jgi:lysophospholipase L1-like esterase
MRCQLRCTLFLSALLISISASAWGADNQADLSRLVVVGDSLTAGFQNFSLFDSSGRLDLPPGGQANGYAAVIARQARVNLTLPLISFPGIPPSLALTPDGVVRLSGLGARENPTVQATDLSVPGFLVADMLAHPFPGNPAANPIDALSDLILASPGLIPGCGPIPTLSGLVVSEVICAVALQPTLILVSIGNNDALQTLTFGVPPTDPGVFAGDVSALLRELAATKATLVIANIPDVTAVPFLVPVPAFRAQCGFVPGGVTSADFVVPNIVDVSAVSLNICTNYAIRPAALVAQAQTAVTQFNAILAQEAALLGAVLVDVHELLMRFVQTGYQAGGAHLSTAFLGGIFSLDGIHPTNTGYAIVANEFHSYNHSCPKQV